MSVAATPAPGTRVLIVDDEENQRSGLANMISGWGFVTETARDGLDALEKFEAFDPQVMLTDMMMPRMDGSELMKKLTERGVRIPVIVITAFGNIETALTTTHDLGAFWFLEKPIQARVLRFLLERASLQNKLAEETEGLRRQLSYLRGHASGVLFDPAGCTHARGGVGDRRKRYRQRDGGPGYSSTESARQWSLCRHQLRRAAGDPHGKRTVRP
jgi:FixJ family two-component response regulator